MIDDVMLEAEELMMNAVENLGREFAKVRTGRANPSMLNHVKVDYYGAPTPISQVGSIATPEANQLVIKPYDKTMVKEVERAILASNLGVNPSNEGDLIRIVLPQLNEERRLLLIKDVRKITETARVAVRNARREANDAIKKLERSSDLTEDDSKGYQEDVQELTDTYIEQINEKLETKEKDLMSI